MKCLSQVYSMTAETEVKRRKLVWVSKLLENAESDVNFFKQYNKCLHFGVQ
jgi:hypothetical protein